MSLACLDIGGSWIKAARLDRPVMPTVIDRHPTPETRNDFISAVASIVQAMGTGISALSISLTGIIDPDTQKLRIANLPMLDGIRLGPELEAVTGLPVLIANDADCFALAEAIEGSGRGHKNVFCIILGSGVGGCLVIDGRIIEGPGGFSGEWGHGTVLMQKAGARQADIPHLRCGCGQMGCVNTVGGARGLEALDTIVTGSTRTSTAILDAWQAGDEETVDLVDIWLDLVSAPLAMTLNVTGSTIVPAGGGLSNSHELLAVLDERVRKRLLRQTAGPVIVPAQLTGEAGLLGAAIRGFESLKHG